MKAQIAAGRSASSHVAAAALVAVLLFVTLPQCSYAGMQKHSLRGLAQTDKPDDSSAGAAGSTSSAGSTTPASDATVSSSTDTSTQGDGTAGDMEKGRPEGASGGPKLYLYAWCGVSQDQLEPGVSPNDDNDFVATIDASPESSTFGQVLSVTSTPYKGTQPHHCNVDNSGKYLAAGGLLSLMQPNTPDIFVFDVSTASKPEYKYGLTSSIGSCVDEFVAARSGGFYVSSMCSRTGGAGGSILRLERPGDSSPKLDEYNGGLSVEDQSNFTSHGIDIDYDSRRIVSADYVVVSTALIKDPLPPLGLQHTVHVWDLDSMKVIKVIDLAGITEGLMESRFTGKKGLFWVSGGLGKLPLINALTFEVSPNAYCLKDNCEDVRGTCLASKIFSSPNGPRMLVASFTLSQVRLLDVSDPYKLKTLDIHQLPSGAGGHVVKYNRETNTAAVATYLLDIKGTVLRMSSDRTVRLFSIDMKNDKIVPLPNGIVDFNSAVPSKGASDCHGIAFKVGN